MRNMSIAQCETMIGKKPAGAESGWCVTRSLEDDGFETVAFGPVQGPHSFATLHHPTQQAVVLSLREFTTVKGLQARDDWQRQQTTPAG